MSAEVLAGILDFDQTIQVHDHHRRQLPTACFAHVLRVASGQMSKAAWVARATLRAESHRGFTHGSG